MTKDRRSIYTLKLLLTVLAILVPATPALGQTDIPAVLYLSSWNPDTEYTRQFEEGLEQELNLHLDELQLYKEYLDARRFSSREWQKDFAEYLRIKYRDKNIAAVVTISAPAEDFLEAYPDITSQERPPINIAAGSNRIEDYSADSKTLWDYRVVVDHRASLQELLKVYPARKILVVGDIIDMDGTDRFSTFQRQLPAGIPGVEIEYAINTPLDELLQRIGQLPAQTAIYYLLSFRDAQGEFLSPTEAAEIITRHANVPVFSHWNTITPHGIVGGYQIDWTRIGKLVGSLLVSYVNGEEIAFDNDSIFVSNYNWDQLKRWNIPHSALPPGANIIGKPPEFIVRYRAHIIFAAIATMALYIILFLVYRNKLIDRRNQILNELARIDGLTRLLNRRALMPMVEDEMRRCEQFDQPVSLLLIDLDRFKSINDRFGHTCGDETLERVAQVLRSSIRTGDRIARWGGEEFLILAAGAKLAQAQFLAEKVRKAVERIRIREVEGLSVSIGVAAYQPPEDFGSWYDRADRALYKAKAQGRNRVAGLDD